MQLWGRMLTGQGLREVFFAFQIQSIACLSHLTAVDTFIVHISLGKLLTLVKLSWYAWALERTSVKFSHSYTCAPIYDLLQLESPLAPHWFVCSCLNLFIFRCQPDWCRVFARTRHPWKAPLQHLEPEEPTVATAITTVAAMPLAVIITSARPTQSVAASWTQTIYRSQLPHPSITIKVGVNVGFVVFGEK